MVKSLENASSVAPFLLKCYEMVDDESTDSLISWSETHRNSFIIWDVSKFSYELLPKYFKHSNLSSFIRQLNIYGFRKTDTDRWEFSNDEFIKGQKHLLKNIVRRKQPPAQEPKRSSQQKDTAPSPSIEDKRAALRKEVESLKVDKNVLMQDLMDLRQLQQTSQSKMTLLREQLKGMEKNQQQMLSFIVLAMQTPVFFAQLFQPKENNWRSAETGKNAISRVVDTYGPVSSDGMIVRYQLPTNEASEPPSGPPSSNLEQKMDFEFPDEMRDVLMNIDFTSGLSDEKLLSVENHGPLVFSDAPDDDFMWDQLLLSSPLSESKGTEELDSEGSLNHGEEMESALQVQESGKSRHPTEGFDQNKRTGRRGAEKQLENSESLDILTTQMGFVNS